MPDRTEDNLRDAFDAECEAIQRYTMYAERAEEEGFPQLAKLFRAVAAAENVHARNHFTVIGGMGTQQDNVLAAKLGEEREYTGMYSIFIDDAREEQNERAVRTFIWAQAVEAIHTGFFDKALEALKTGKSLPETTYHVCGICGNTVTGEAPDKCIVCGAGKESFNEIE